MSEATTERDTERCACLNNIEKLRKNEQNIKKEDSVKKATHTHLPQIYHTMEKNV